MADALTERSPELHPILIAGCGRSGTTALMRILATDPQVAFDREYPYEFRHLTYYAKLASILSDRPPDPRLLDEQLYVFEENAVGPCPWLGHNAGKHVDWLRLFWDAISSEIKQSRPLARFYAEKVPVWLPSMVRSVARSCSVVYLFRDPRDVFISSNAFMEKRSYYSFHRLPGDGDLDHARSLGAQWIEYFENCSHCWPDANKDGFLLRYEDLASCPDEFIEWLRSLDLSLDLDRAFEEVEGHRTSPSIQSSVGRWTREYLSPAVRGFFERHLGREMQALGYEIEEPGFCPSVDFAQCEAELLIPNPAHGAIERGSTEATIRISGADFHLLLPLEPFPADGVSEVWVSVAGRVGDHFSIYWRDSDSDFAEERSMHATYVPGAHWRIVRFPVAQHELWSGTIEQLRLDPFNSGSAEAEGSGAIRWLKLIS